MAGGTEVAEEFIRRQGGWCVGHTRLPTGEKPLPADTKGSKWGFSVSPATVEGELAAGTCSELGHVCGPENTRGREGFLHEEMANSLLRARESQEYHL